MFKMVSLNHCRSYSSILEKWVKITSTLLALYLKTHSWTGWFLEFRFRIQNYPWLSVCLYLIFLLLRDLVHRQTACAAIKHMALGVHGFGCEDALIHLLNYVWPNVFETSPHLVQAFMDSVDGLRVSLGPVKILQYTLQV